MKQSDFRGRLWVCRATVILLFEFWLILNQLIYRWTLDQNQNTTGEAWQRLQEHHRSDAWC